MKMNGKNQKKNIAMKTNGNKKNMAIKKCGNKKKHTASWCGAANFQNLDVQHRRSSAAFAVCRAWCCQFFCENRELEINNVQGE